MSVDLHFRPLDHSSWVADGRGRYQRCPFKASWSKNLSQLRYELEKLRAPRAVIEIDFEGEDLRLDGLPRATARPKSPRVRLSFDAPEIGAQCYMCDTYGHWQENLRGIVLTLERLRAIERYGSTRGKQQYKGWGALPAHATNGFANRTEAAAFLARHSGLDAHQIEIIPAVAKHAYRIAAARHHPDKGGDEQLMARTNQARERLK